MFNLPVRPAPPEFVDGSPAESNSGKLPRNMAQRLARNMLRNIV
jgi:hypothetical protein